jgi:hypothetical protein
MSVRRHENGNIVLEGDCPAEDAETLLQMLQAAPGVPIDWTQCSQLHTAVLQVILAAAPALIGACGDPWVARWFVVTHSEI